MNAPVPSSFCLFDRGSWPEASRIGARLSHASALLGDLLSRPL